jgi:tRNA modification GTPase
LDNGRLDLAQVEGLADLLAAETEAQRRHAMRVMSGPSWARLPIAGASRDLVRALALIEATIDFADEDVPVDVSPEVGILDSAVLQRRCGECPRLLALSERIARRVRGGDRRRAECRKEHASQRLAGREAAITSKSPGRRAM